jgi:hypothetical protein
MGEMFEAYKNYTANGIIVHPLCPPIMGDRRTGKSPIPLGWQKRGEPYSEKYIEQETKKGCNLGILCGKLSDVTILDIDWYRAGIAGMLYKGLDKESWVRQLHGEGFKGHIIFKYSRRVMPGLNQDLGFDVLTQNKLGGGSNCVCAPSVHADGTKYWMTKPITERTEMPDVLADRINELVRLYDDLLGVLGKCRRVWRLLWRAIFTDKQDELYHYTQVFRGSKEGRDRSLGLFAELMQHGATDEQLLLVCALIFGNDYDSDMCEKNLRNISPKCTMTKARILADPILSMFQSSAEFDVLTASLEDMESKLTPEAMEIYEMLITESTVDSLDRDRRMFLAGHYTR